MYVHNRGMCHLTEMQLIKYEMSIKLLRGPFLMVLLLFIARVITNFLSESLEEIALYLNQWAMSVRSSSVHLCKNRLST